jgi:hypothetical protein
MDVTTRTRDYISFPISRLPQEVLCHIFRLYFADLRYWFLDRNGCGRLYEWVVTLSYVCRLWHTLIMDMAELFAWIHIAHTTRREHIETLLAMSRDSDLNVYISVWDPWGAAPGMIELLQPHVGRLRSLVISKELGNLETLFSGTCPAPARLEVLHVERSPGRSVLAILPSSLSSLPDLALHSPMDWTYRRWHRSLRRLCLRSNDLAPQDGVPFLRQLLGYLRGMPGLQKLKLQYPYHGDLIIDEAIMQPVYLAHLTDLDLVLPPEGYAALCRYLNWGGGRLFLPLLYFAKVDEQSVKLLEQLALALRRLLSVTDARRPLRRLTFSSVGGIVEIDLTCDTQSFADDREPLNREERRLYHGLFLGIVGDVQMTEIPHVVALRPIWRSLSLLSLTLIGSKHTFSQEGFRTAFARLDQVNNVEIVQIACPVLLSTLSADPVVLPALSRLWIRRSDHIEHTEQEWLHVLNQLVGTFGSGGRPRPHLQLLRLDELPHAPVSAEDIVQLEGCAELVLLRSSSDRVNPDFTARENGRTYIDSQGAHHPHILGNTGLDTHGARANAKK